MSTNHLKWHKAFLLMLLGSLCFEVKAQNYEYVYIPKYKCNPQTHILKKLPEMYAINEPVLPWVPAKNEAASEKYYEVVTGLGAGKKGSLDDIKNFPEVKPYDRLNEITRFAQFNSDVTKKSFRVFRKITHDECNKKVGAKDCGIEGLLNILQGVAMSQDKNLGALISNGEGVSDIAIVDLNTGKPSILFTAAASMLPYGGIQTKDQIQFVNDKNGNPRFIAFNEVYLTDDRDASDGPPRFPTKLITFYDLKSKQRISVHAKQINNLVKDKNLIDIYDRLDQRLYHAVKIEQLFAAFKKGNLITEHRIEEYFQPARGRRVPIPVCPMGLYKVR